MFLGFFGGFFNRFGQSYTLVAASASLKETLRGPCDDLRLDDPRGPSISACG